MFSDFSIDRWVGIVGLLMALIGIWLAYHFYRKSVRTKVLAIAYTAPVPLMLPVQDVTIFYLGTNYDALSRAYILFWNRGTAPIEASDFVQPINIRSTEKVLQVLIFDKDAAATAEVQADENDIYIDLLRPGEAIILQIDVAEEAYKPDISVVMKSPDMSVMLETPRAFVPPICGWGFGLIAFFGLEFFVPDVFTASYEASSWLHAMADSLSLFFFIGLATMAGFLVYSVVKGIMKHSISPVASRFFDMQMQAISAIEDGRKLNKKIVQIARKTST